MAKMVAPAFLEKLFEMLEDVTLQPYISWQPDGQSFLIKQPNAFSESILPNYFKHNNLQSFVRQLNMYSFTKTRHDSNYREFRQPNFQKGRRDLLSLIKRKTQGTSQKNGSNGSDDGRGNNIGTDPDDFEDMDDDRKIGSGNIAASSSSSHSFYDSKIEDTSTSSQIHELRSYIEKLESQVWTLNERYRVLSSKYEQLEDRFSVLERTTETATSHEGRQPDESHHMDRDSTDAADEDSSRCSPPTASSSMPIVRMISIDPNVGNGTRKLDDEEAPDSDFSSVSMNLTISQNKRGAGAVVGGIPDHMPGKTPKAAKCGDHRQGGLHAIAVAASLLDAHEE